MKGRDMQKFLAIFATLVAVCAALVGIQTSATAAGCTTAAWVNGNQLIHSEGNLLGGAHVWRVRAMKSDCDGFDKVYQYTVVLNKENGRCSNGSGAHINNYDVNPNALDGYNPGTRTYNCNSGTTTYTTYFVPSAPLYIYSSQPASARCVGAEVQIDKGPVLGDYNGSVPSLCFNGL